MRQVKEAEGMLEPNSLKAVIWNVHDWSLSRPPKVHDLLKKKLGLVVWVTDTVYLSLSRKLPVGS